MTTTATTTLIITHRCGHTRTLTLRGGEVTARRVQASGLADALARDRCPRCIAAPLAAPLIATPQAPTEPPTIYTIGHSTHTAEEFCALLAAHHITTLVDIRSYPASRHCPQFNQEALHETLATHGVRYLHLRDLGGRRHTIIAGSGNDGWRVAAFRAYADYAATSPGFAAALAHLMQIARTGGPTAYLCAEQSHYQCHRRIVSDYLLARGWRVWHIPPTLSAPLTAHVYPAHARVGEDGQVRYPATPGAVTSASLWASVAPSA